MALSNRDRRTLAQKIEDEGFDYCFRDYSSWEEIKDTKLHKLIAFYKKAAQALEVYVDAGSVDLSEDDPEDE